MSAHVSTAIYLRDGKPLRVTLNTNTPSRPFATIDLDYSDAAYAYMVVYGRAQAEALVKAALAARDLLPEEGTP